MSSDILTDRFDIDYNVYYCSYGDWLNKVIELTNEKQNMDVDERYKLENVSSLSLFYRRSSSARLRTRR